MLYARTTPTAISVAAGNFLDAGLRPALHLRGQIWNSIGVFRNTNPLSRIDPKYTDRYILGMTHQNATRTALLEQSLRLFAAQGYEGVGVQQICNDAGVGKPTLYHYFGSKLGLLETLLRERLAPLHEALERACALTPFDHALVALAEATFAFAREEPQLYRFYLTLWFAPAESEARQAAEEHHQRHFEAFDACFRAHEQASGHGLTGRHRLLAASFLGLVNNHIGIALNSFATLNARSAADTVAMFLNGALPPASSNGD